MTRPLDWRPMSRSDAGAVLALINACYEEASSQLRVSMADFDQRYSGKDPGEDSLVAVDPDGAMLAGGFVNEAFEFQSAWHIQLMGYVDPLHRGRGLGRRVLRWQLHEGERRYRRLRPELPGMLKAECTDNDNSGLFRRFGMTEISRLVQVEYDIRGTAPGTATPPLGVIITPYHDRYADQVRTLFNNAFHDYWMSKPYTPESWQSEVAGSPQFRPEYSMLAIAGDEVASFILVFSMPGADMHGRRVLAIRGMGTKENMRGQGLGSLLARATAAAVRADGRYDIVRASMETLNSAVLQVAERVGAQTVGHTATFAMPLVPGQGRVHAGGDRDDSRLAGEHRQAS